MRPMCIPHITHVPSFSYHLSYTSACSKTILSKKNGGLVTYQFWALARQLFAVTQRTQYETILEEFRSLIRKAKNIILESCSLNIKHTIYSDHSQKDRNCFAIKLRKKNICLDTLVACKVQWAL
jgi:hypothetical protein